MIDTQQEFTQFGRDLIVTQDLDPLYVGVYRAGLPQPELGAFLLTYWMFYNAGFASQATDMYHHHGGEGYWSLLKHSVPGTVVRRGAERRHFRGDIAVRAVDTLAEWYPNPVQALEYVTGGHRRVTFPDVFNAVQKWPLFGPWIAFKAADMLDRCGYCAVGDTGCDLSMYETPVKGARLYAELAGQPGAHIGYAIGELSRAYTGLTAPPAHDRPIGIYEVETVLCKAKSAAGGHYYVGKDTIEIRHMLSHYRDSPTAQRILAGMPDTTQLELLY